MRIIQPLLARINGSYLILSTSILSVFFSIAAILLFKSIDPAFSLFVNWLPTQGERTPQIVSLVFCTGLVVMCPLMILIHLYLVNWLKTMGAGKRSRALCLALGLISCLGQLLVVVIPYPDFPLGHTIVALLFFIGSALYGLAYGATELRIKEIPRYLGLSGFIMAIPFLIFSGSLVLVTLFPNISYNPAIWEWLSYFSITAWGLVHGGYLFFAEKRPLKTEASLTST